MVNGKKSVEVWKSLASVALLLASIGSFRARAASSDVDDKLLPTPKQLSADLSWKYPWELPAQLVRFKTADEYREAARRELPPTGMTAEQAKAIVDETASQFAAEGAGDGARQGAIFCVILFRTYSLPLAQMMDENLVKTADTLFRAVSADPKADGEKALVEAMCAPYKDLSIEQIKTTAVKAATLIQKASAMEYAKSNNWEGLADEDAVKKGVWLGLVKITVMQVDPKRVGEVEDLKDAPGLENRLNASLKKLLDAAMRMEERRVQTRIDRLGGDADSAKLAQQLRDELARKRGDVARASFKVYPRQFGDNSYVVRLQCNLVDMPGLNISLYSGWIRNGTALVKIEFGGNFPEEQMLKEMDHFLAEMEARTNSLGGP